MSLFGPLSPEPMAQPKGPDGKPQGPPPISWLLALGMAGAVLGSLASNLDTRLTAFALQDLRGGTGLAVDEASWVSTAYNIAEVAVVPLTPWLSSIISPRRAIAIAIALLTVAGAFVPSYSANYPVLIFLRFLQGIGGGSLIPLLLLTVLRFTPVYQRVFGLAVYGFVTAVTPLLADSLAGILTDRIGWQSIFYIAIPLGPIVVLLVMIGLPVEPVKPEAFFKTDYTGMLLLAIFAGTLTAGLGVGQRLDWFDSPLVDSLFASSACTLLGFVILELHLDKPLIDLRLLLRRNFACGLLMMFAFGFASLFTSNILPQFGSQVRGFRELEVGEILIWGALVQVFVCIGMPFLLRMLEARVALAVGLFLSVLACRLATFIDSEWVAVDLMLAMLISTASQVVILVPTTIVSTSVLKPEDALSGGTIFNVVRNLATSIGGAVIGGVLTVRERVHSFYTTSDIVTGAPLTEARGGLAALATAVRAQSVTQATADAFGWSAVAVMIAFGVVLAMNPTRIPFPPGKHP